ncbi:MAG TPA: LysR family transcriptional regulator [Solirubrobacterales bacterium]|nr:LysR family transcriptional regulator [Solirubrobacterales bacterium]
MELRQLRYVEAVARHRHFTRAAEEMHVAQSALSQQVRRLEAELGTELFERTSRRVAPTEAGEAVAARARRVLAEVDGVHEEVDELRGVTRGRISIGALLPGGDIDVPDLVARFSETHPGIEVGLHEGTAGDMFRRLEEDTVDAAFCLLYGELPEGIVSEVLSEDEVVAVFAPGAAPARKQLGVADLKQYAMVAPRPGSTIKAAVDDRFARAGETLRVSLESGDPFLLRCLVAGGFGAGILPSSLTRREGPPIEVRRLRPPLRLPVALLWREHRHTSPAAGAFIDFVRSEAGLAR